MGVLVKSHDLHLAGFGFEQLDDREGLVDFGEIDEDNLGGIGAQGTNQIGGLGVAFNLASDVDVAGLLEYRGQAFTDFGFGWK